MIARRQFLASVLAGSAALALAIPAAKAQTPAIGAIRVDVSALQSQGWGGHALAIKLGMERELAEALGADYRRGRGATLVVTVRGVFLNSYAGSGGMAAAAGVAAAAATPPIPSTASPLWSRPATA